MQICLTSNQCTILDKDKSIPANAVPLCFETIRFHQNRIPLWDYHAERIKNTLNYFNNTDVFEKKLFIPLNKDILIAAKREKISSSRLKLQFFNVPLSSENQRFYLSIRFHALPAVYLNQAYYKEKMSFYQKNFIQLNHLSKFKLNQTEPYQHLWENLQQNTSQLIKNENGEWVESTIGNIFFKIKGKWFTPGIESGCIDGVMRKFVIVHQDKLNLSISFMPLKDDDLSEITSFFWTNALRGVVPVKKIEGYSQSLDYTEAFQIRQKAESILAETVNA